MENEGYQGRINHPARANHRIIRMKLGDENGASSIHLMLTSMNTALF